MSDEQTKEKPHYFITIEMSSISLMAKREVVLSHSGSQGMTRLKVFKDGKEIKRPGYFMHRFIAECDFADPEMELYLRNLTTVVPMNPKTLLKALRQGPIPAQFDVRLNGNDMTGIILVRPATEEEKAVR